MKSETMREEGNNCTKLRNVIFEHFFVFQNNFWPSLSRFLVISAAQDTLVKLSPVLRALRFHDHLWLAHLRTLDILVQVLVSLFPLTQPRPLCTHYVSPQCIARFYGILSGKPTPRFLTRPRGPTRFFLLLNTFVIVLIVCNNVIVEKLHLITTFYC